MKTPQDEIECPEIYRPWYSEIDKCGLSDHVCALERGENCDYLDELKEGEDGGTLV